MTIATMLFMFAKGVSVVTISAKVNAHDMCTFASHRIKKLLEIICNTKYSV